MFTLPYYDTSKPDKRVVVPPTARSALQMLETQIQLNFTPTIKN